MTFLRGRHGLSLSEAKATVDRILDGRIVHLPGSPQELDRLGVVVFLPPGTAAPRSGRYAEIGPRGGETGVVVTVRKKGNRLPPTRRKGTGYTLAARTA